MKLTTSSNLTDNKNTYKKRDCGCSVVIYPGPNMHICYNKKECKSHINHPTRTYYSKSIVNRYFKKVYL